MRYNLFALLVVLLSGSTAFSQIHQTDSSAVRRSYNLNPIVVTGSGHHQRLKSTATPVRVLSSQEMREQGITTFDGALTRMMPQASMAPSSMGRHLKQCGSESYQHVARETYRGAGWSCLITLW